MSFTTIDEIRVMLSILQMKVQAQQMQLLSIIETQQAEIEELKATKRSTTPWKRSTQPSPAVTPKGPSAKDKAEMAKNLKLNLSRVNQADVIELKKQIRESLSVLDKQLASSPPEAGSSDTTSGTYTTLELQDMLDSLLNLPNYIF